MGVQNRSKRARPRIGLRSLAEYIERNKQGVGLFGINLSGDPRDRRGDPPLFGAAGSRGGWETAMGIVSGDLKGRFAPRWDPVALVRPRPPGASTLCDPTRFLLFLFFEFGVKVLVPRGTGFEGGRRKFSPVGRF